MLVPDIRYNSKNKNTIIEILQKYGYKMTEQLSEK
jgi:hypothetical protein